jgi:nanoRNase/pAp phosphatase (c-di-AMP/oligoRNAs hydrolase)
MTDSDQNDQQNSRGPIAKMTTKMADLLTANRGKRHVIVMQDFPDPDAISTAFAHQLLSAEYDIEADIIYSGRISHQQNIALVRLLGIRLIHYEPDLDLAKYDGAVFVDNQGTTADEIVRALEAADVPNLIIVDHHEIQERLVAEFSDIRPTGAAATIYAQYLEQGLIQFDASRKEHILVATALMHGIITDTNGFTQAQPEDFLASAYLSQFRDADLLSQIMSQARSKRVMEIIWLALGNRVLVENFSIAGINYVRAEDRDAIPQAADFLLSEENVHTAIVYGIVTGDEREETLIGSLRTSKITIDPDQFIKEAFGKDEVGQYFGGGKTLAGGFEIPIGFLAGDYNPEFKDLKWQVYDQQIKQKIFAKLGIEPEQ